MFSLHHNTAIRSVAFIDRTTALLQHCSQQHDNILYCIIYESAVSVVYILYIQTRTRRPHRAERKNKNIIIIKNARGRRVRESEPVVGRVTREIQ